MMAHHHNTGSQSSNPAINVIGEQVPPPQDPFLDLEDQQVLGSSSCPVWWLYQPELAAGSCFRGPAAIQ